MAGLEIEDSEQQWQQAQRAWHTFEKLLAQHDAYVNVSLAGMGRVRGKMQQRAGNLQRRMDRG